MSTLLRSQIVTGCGEVIASLHRHDFHSCRCGCTAIDGGRDYLRISAREGFSYTPAHIEVEQDLTNEQARNVMTALKAVHDLELNGPGGWHTTQQVMVRAIQKFQKPAYDPRDAPILEDLKLLHRNGLVERRRGQGYEWRVSPGVHLEARG